MTEIFRIHPETPQKRLMKQAADRMRASPHTAVWLNRVAGTLLVGFGVKLALGK